MFSCKIYIFLQNLEASSGSYQTSMMEVFAKIVNGFQSLTVLAKLYNRSLTGSYKTSETPPGCCSEELFLIFSSDCVNVMWFALGTKLSPEQVLFQQKLFQGQAIKATSKSQFLKQYLSVYL